MKRHLGVTDSGRGLLYELVDKSLLTRTAAEAAGRCLLMDHFTAAAELPVIAVQHCYAC